MVGFEPTASRSRTERATRLRHTPNIFFKRWRVVKYSHSTSPYVLAPLQKGLRPPDDFSTSAVSRQTSCDSTFAIIISNLVPLATIRTRDLSLTRGLLLPTELQRHEILTIVDLVRQLFALNWCAWRDSNSQRRWF